MKLLIAVLLFAAPLARATTVESFLRNREGIGKLKEKAYLGAYQAFLKALAEEPLNPEIQMNLALTFENNEEYDKAEAAYKGTLKLLPEKSAERFEVLFNLAGVLGKEHKIDEALADYQECLTYQPESKEIKTNIELLWQGGGGGEGDSKDQKDDKNGKDKKNPKEGEGNDRKNSQPQTDQQKEQKKQPKPFQSQELNAQDVKKILDEIKNQEQAIRAEEYERNAKEQGNSKDW